MPGPGCGASANLATSAPVGYALPTEAKIGKYMRRKMYQSVNTLRASQSANVLRVRLAREGA
jgi:hypothetical protein